VIEGAYNITEDLAHSKTKVFFPIVMTFFLFIITANWLSLFPGFGTIGFYQMHEGQKVFVPFLRAINADLNTTLALALISAITTHLFSIYYLGILNYLKHWFSLNPIFLFVGLIEIVSEFTKIVSLSFRLFGNIFAGEVVLATIAGIFAFVAPLPFYFLEIIVGFVQAAVFMMLSLVFMVLLSEKHE
jgi:F-type H+-transporting ATPase subunit a